MSWDDSNIRKRRYVPCWKGQGSAWDVRMHTHTLMPAALTKIQVLPCDGIMLTSRVEMRRVKSHIYLIQ